MNYRLVVRTRVQRAIYDAARYYASRNKSTGDRFFAESDAIFDRLKDHPKAYPVVDHPFRRALFDRFPYSMYFQIIGEEVHIVALFHQSRDLSTLEL
jgi:plasmid stabilization system protein ParE